MNSIRFICAALVLAAFTVISAHAQTKPTGIAVIDSNAFSDDKPGILRIVRAIKQVGALFEPQRMELKRMQDQLNALRANPQKSSVRQAPKMIARQKSQADQLEIQIKHKQEDAQSEYQKRMSAALDPLQRDVYNALRSFVQARGIAVLIDLSRMPLIYVADSVDITRDFIAEYNRTHPATTTP